MKRIVSSLVVELLFLGLFAFVFTVQPVRAPPENIIINPDGSISSPVPANITTSDNVTYTFTGNNYLTIVVNRSNIIINGGGYTLQVSGGIGFYLEYPVNNVTIKDTTITNSAYGIDINGSYNDTLSGNNVTANSNYGVGIQSSSGNTFYHNNFVGNAQQVISDGSPNAWDNGYPSGGNYWSDYSGKDQYEGPSQNMPGNDTIGDTPYEINVNNTDRYPLMAPYEPLRRLFLESEGQWKIGEAPDIEVRSVFASDVDGDGVVEIMTCGHAYQSAELRIYSYNGLAITLEHSELWQTYGATSAWSVFASDVDGDGVTEILVGGETTLYGQLRIWNWNGTTLTLEHSEEWQTVSWTHVYSVFAADIDNDGVTEIITRGNAYNGTSYNNQLLIWSWNGAALSLESGREWGTSGGGVSARSVCAWDVDGDSTVEIVTVGLEISVAQLRIWNWNGTVLTVEHSEEWKTPGSSSGQALSVLTSDIDNDGTVEIVTSGDTIGSTEDGQLRVWNWNGSTLKLETNIDWPLNGTPAYVWTICAGDVDSDGLAEVMTAGVSGVNAQLRVWSFNGSTLKLDADQEYSYDGASNPVFACDADGDGTIEIMTAGVTYEARYGYEHIKIWSFPEFVPPAITILSPENKTYSTSTVPLTFTVDEPAKWIGYSLNGQANVTISGNTTLSTLPDGWHHVTIYANDTYGNVGFATVYSNVDTTKPNITNVVQNPLTSILPDTVVKINATVTDATSGVKQVLLNCTFTNSTNTWYAAYSMAHPIGDVWNATIPPQPYGTNVTYMIIAEDNVGNTITTEQLGYEYVYQVVPEFTLSTVVIVFVIAASLIAIVSRREHFPHETK